MSREAEAAVMQDTEVATVPVVVRAREIADLARGMAAQIDSGRRLIKQQ